MVSPETKVRFHQRMAEVLKWIFEVGATGERPTHGFENEEFKPDSVRGKMAGCKFADGCGQIPI